MDYPQIIAYLNGHCTEAEKEAVEKWKQADPEHQVLFDQFQQLWAASKANVEHEKPDVDLAWQKVKGQSIDQKKLKPLWRRRIAGIAAILLIGLLAYLSKDRWMPNQIQMVSAQNGANPTQVVLADGSKVWLNKDSKLVFSKRFNGPERLVELTGEAFFDVQRNEKKPFRIITPDAQIEVLGTSFDVMAYPDSSKVRVQVSSGSVAFSMAGKEKEALILNKGEEGFFDKSELQLVKAQKQQTNRMAWKTKVLEFDNTSISRAISLIEDVYGVNIEMTQPEIGNCRFTTTFDNETLEVVLETISSIFDIVIEEKQTNIYSLSGQGCPAVQ